MDTKKPAIKIKFDPPLTLDQVENLLASLPEENPATANLPSFFRDGENAPETIRNGLDIKHGPPEYRLHLRFEAPDEDGLIHGLSYYPNNFGFTRFDEFIDIVFNEDQRAILMSAFDMDAIMKRDEDIREIVSIQRNFREIFEHNVSEELKVAYGSKMGTLSDAERAFLDKLPYLFDPGADHIKNDPDPERRELLWKINIQNIEAQAFRHENFFASQGFRDRIEIMKAEFPDWAHELDTIIEEYRLYFDLDLHEAFDAGMESDERALSEDIRDFFHENAQDLPTNAFDRYFAVLEELAQYGNQMDSLKLKTAMNNMLREVKGDLKTDLQDIVKPDL